MRGRIAAGYWWDIEIDHNSLFPNGKTRCAEPLANLPTS
jgi:hypothetical protein